MRQLAVLEIAAPNRPSLLLACDRLVLRRSSRERDSSLDWARWRLRAQARW